MCRKRFLMLGVLSLLPCLLPSISHAQVNPPVVDDITPRDFTTGNRVVIVGKGFGNNPDNLCIKVDTGNGTAVPLRAIAATDTRITAVVGPVRERAQGVIVVTPGAGESGDGNTGCDGLQQGQTTWSWGPVPGIAGNAGPGVNPFPSDPPQNVRWFFADQQDGRVSLRLPADWCPGAKVTITGRLLATNGKGYDFQHEGFRLDIPNGAPAEECARLICCLILEKCRQLATDRPEANVGTFSCDVVANPAGGTTIVLSIKDGNGNICPLVISFLSVCVECPPGGVIINDVMPRDLSPGGTVMILGQGFGNNPDNLCVKALAGNGEIIPIRAVRATDDKITGIVGPFPPTATSCQIMVTPGAGTSGPGTTDCEGVAAAFPDAWGWIPTGQQAAVGPDINPVPIDPPPGTKWYYARQEDNQVSLLLPDPWCRGAKVTITGRLLADNKGYDFQYTGFSFSLPNGGSALECAKIICCLIQKQCALDFKHLGGTGSVACDAVETPEGVKIVLTLRDAAGNICPLVISYLSVCVECPGECDRECQAGQCCQPTGCAGVKVTTVLPPDQCQFDVYVTIRSFCKRKLIKECIAKFDLPGGDPANPALCAENWTLQDKCLALVRAIRRDCTASGYAVEEHCDQDPPFFILRDVTCPGSQVVLGISNDPDIFGGQGGQPIPDYEAEIIEPLCDDPADPDDNPAVDVVLRGTANGKLIVEEMPSSTVAIVLRGPGGLSRAEVQTTAGKSAAEVAAALLPELTKLGADAQLFDTRIRIRLGGGAGAGAGGGGGVGFDGAAGATNDGGITLGNRGGPESVLVLPPPIFHRGDSDDNGSLQLTDAVRILGFLFLGDLQPTCMDAADADDNGSLQLTDAVRILGYLFLGGPAPPDPGPPPPPCGVDPTDDLLGCASYTHC